MDPDAPAPEPVPGDRALTPIRWPSSTNTRCPTAILPAMAQYRFLHLVGARAGLAEHLHRPARLFLIQPELVFVRGNLQKDAPSERRNFPASLPVRQSQRQQRTGRRPHLDNLCQLDQRPRYSYIRQGYASYGIGQGAYANFYGMSTLDAETRTNIVNVPVQNLVDDLTWTHSHHTLQFGANYRLIHNQSRERCPVVQFCGHQLLCPGRRRHRRHRTELRSQRHFGFPAGQSATSSVRTTSP